MNRIKKLAEKMVKIYQRASQKEDTTILIDLYSLEGATVEDIIKNKLPHMFKVTKITKNKKETIQWIYDPVTDDLYFLDPNTNSYTSLREIHNLPPPSKGS
jgi:hypothetical protein